MKNKEKDTQPEIATVHIQSRRANNIDYQFHHHDDSTVTVYEFADGLPLKRVYGPTGLEDAENFITMREKVDFPLQRLC